ncbi:MAG: ribokinase [Clostridiaceae bacterium]
MNKVSVLGSINIDVVVKVKDMPYVGQTIIGESLKYIPGGKGANQAVAAKRLGSEVSIIGKTGRDDSGRNLINQLSSEGINTEYILMDEGNSTGTAIITVNDQGDNSIIVIPGANMTISERELDIAKSAIKDCDVLIAQFETPIDITISAFKFARANEIITILNPAPAKAIPEELLSYTDIIIPNETEASELCSLEEVTIENVEEALRYFVEKGVKYAIITLGDKGAAITDGANFEIIPAIKVKAVDTTAAGDTFIGALASKLDKKKLSFSYIKEAVAFGNKASSIAVQRPGAQPSIPRLEEL